MRCINVRREELHEPVWSKPRTTMAKELGISDVRVGKLCRDMNRYEIPGGRPVLCRRLIVGVRLRHESQRRAPKRRTQGCGGATRSGGRDRSSARKLSEAWINGAYRLRLAVTLSVQLRFGASILGIGRGFAGCRCARPAPASRNTAASPRMGGCDPDRPRYGRRQADLQFASCNRNRTATGLAVFSPLRSLQRPAQLVEAEARAKRVRWMVRGRGGACSLDTPGIDMARSPSRFLSLAGARIGSFAHGFQSLRDGVACQSSSDARRLRAHFVDHCRVR